MTRVRRLATKEKHLTSTRSGQITRSEAQAIMRAAYNEESEEMILSKLSKLFFLPRCCIFSRAVQARSQGGPGGKPSGHVKLDSVPCPCRNEYSKLLAPLIGAAASIIFQQGRRHKMAPNTEESGNESNSCSCDFEALNFLLKAPSKDFVKKLLQDCFLHLHSKMPRQFYEQTANSLEMQPGDAHKMLLSISELIKLTLFKSMTDPKEVFAVFPDDFHKNLRELLSNMIADCMPLWRSETISQQVSLPRLVDFDWRIDVKTGASSRMSHPSCLLQLKVDGGWLDGDMTREGAKSVNVELTKDTLETMLDGLVKIRLQLNSVVSR